MIFPSLASSTDDSDYPGLISPIQILLTQGNYPEIRRDNRAGKGKLHRNNQTQRWNLRYCLSIFIYGETNKQFRAYGQTVYEETIKIKTKALSWNQRQGNQNAYYTKTPRWIPSKLTPADTSRLCASFRIWCLSHQNSTVTCIAQTFTTTWNSTIIKHGAAQKKIPHLVVSEKALLPHSQKYSSSSRCPIEQYRDLLDKSLPQIFL